MCASPKWLGVFQKTNPSHGPRTGETLGRAMRRHAWVDGFNLKSDWQSLLKTPSALWALKLSARVDCSVTSAMRRLDVRAAVHSVAALLKVPARAASAPGPLPSPEIPGVDNRKKSCKEHCDFFYEVCTFERNSPSLAVALNWGMGSSSLKALVKALHRLQRVRVENS